MVVPALTPPSSVVLLDPVPDVLDLQFAAMATASPVKREIRKARTKFKCSSGVFRAALRRRLYLCQLETGTPLVVMDEAFFRQVCLDAGFDSNNLSQYGTLAEGFFWEDTDLGEGKVPGIRRRIAIEYKNLQVNFRNKPSGILTTPTGAHKGLGGLTQAGIDDTRATLMEDKTPRLRTSTATFLEMRLNDPTHHLLDIMYKTVKKKLPVSATAQMITDHIHNCIVKLCARDSMRGRIKEGAEISDHHIAQWAVRSAFSDIRNAGTDPVTREMMGARTERERGKKKAMQGLRALIERNELRLSWLKGDKCDKTPDERAKEIRELQGAIDLAEDEITKLDVGTLSEGVKDSRLVFKSDEDSKPTDTWTDIRDVGSMMTAERMEDATDWNRIWNRVLAIAMTHRPPTAFIEDDTNLILMRMHGKSEQDIATAFKVTVQEACTYIKNVFKSVETDLGIDQDDFLHRARHYYMAASDEDAPRKLIESEKTRLEKKYLAEKAVREDRLAEIKAAAQPRKDALRALLEKRRAEAAAL